MGEAEAEDHLLRFKKVLIHPQVLHQVQVPTTPPAARPAARPAAHQPHQAPATPLHHPL